MQLIQNQEALNKCVAQLNSVQKIAVDLEFDKNRFRFGFNLCLIQIYDGSEVYLIDPFEKIELKEIFTIFQNPQIQKVVFSFDEDLRLLHSLGCFPKNICDVHIAARLLNFPPISHTNLVKEILNVEVAQSAQNSNWFTRPLSDKQKEYAADDVLHLFDLQNALEKKVFEKGILEWFLEENKFLETLDYSKEPSIVYKKETDKKGLSEFQWFIFENLLDFREQLAEQNNKPSYQIIHKDNLKEIVQRPSKLSEWKKLKGVLKTLQTDDFLTNLKNYIENLNRQAESLKLSRTVKAKILKDKEELDSVSKSERDKTKNNIYIPLKAKLIEKLGENAATFILPNRLILELSSGNESKILNYKKKLFSSL